MLPSNWCESFLPSTAPLAAYPPAHVPAHVPARPQVKPALEAIRALGPVLEDHLQLLLPALNRLIVPGSSGLPLSIQEETLATMQDLLPRMQLAGFSSTVLHPLIRLLDGPSEELRERALDTLCSVSLAIGPDFAIFVPTIKKVGKDGAESSLVNMPCRLPRLPASTTCCCCCRRSWVGTACPRTLPLGAWPASCCTTSRPACRRLTTGRAAAGSWQRSTWRRPSRGSPRLTACTSSARSRCKQVGSLAWPGLP